MVSIDSYLVYTPYGSYVGAFDQQFQYGENGTVLVAQLRDGYSKPLLVEGEVVGEKKRDMSFVFDVSSVLSTYFLRFNVLPDVFADVRSCVLSGRGFCGDGDVIYTVNIVDGKRELFIQDLVTDVGYLEYIE